MAPKNNVLNKHPVPAKKAPRALSLISAYSVSRAATSALPGVSVQFTAQPINRLNSPLAIAGRVLAATIVAGSGATLSATSITTNSLGIATVTLTVGPSVAAGTIYRVKVTDVEGLTGTSANLTVVVDTAVAGVVIAPGTLALIVGATSQLTSELQNAAGHALNGSATAYHSSAPSIATVSSSGLVRAIAPGSATITATAPFTSNGCVVTVSPVPDPTDPTDDDIAAYAVTGAATSALPGGSVVFTAQPINHLNAPLIVVGRVLAVTIVTGAGATLSAPSITTNAQGLATVTLTVGGAVAAGTVYRVKVTDVDSFTGTSANLTVATDTTPAAVVISPATLALLVGSTGPLSSELQNAAGHVVNGAATAWHSSAPSVATVSNSGLVTAIAAGSATITATAPFTSNGCTVTVTAPPDPGDPGGGGSPGTIQSLIDGLYDVGFMKVFAGAPPASTSIEPTSAFIAENRITSPAWGTPFGSSVIGVNWSFVTLNAIGAGQPRFLYVLDAAGGNPIFITLPAAVAWAVGEEVTLTLTATES